VVGSRVVASAGNAALANGMLAHADETDDSHSRSPAHPGCGVVAASSPRHGRARARERPVAAARGGARLRRLLQADAVAQRDPVPRGGPFDAQLRPDLRAAAAAGALAAWTRGASATCSPTRRSRRPGSRAGCATRSTSRKPSISAACPRATAVAAAAMVAHGFTGLEDVLSGERNFFVAYGRSPDPEELARELGGRYEIMTPTSSAGRSALRSRRPSIRC